MSSLCTLQLLELQCRMAMRLTNCWHPLQWSLPLPEGFPLSQSCCVIGRLRWHVQRHEQKCSCHKLQCRIGKDSTDKLIYLEGCVRRAPALSLVKRKTAFMKLLQMRNSYAEERGTHNIVNYVCDGNFRNEDMLNVKVV